MHISYSASYFLTGNCHILETIFIVWKLINQSISRKWRYTFFSTFIPFSVSILEFYCSQKNEMWNVEKLWNFKIQSFM